MNNIEIFNNEYFGDIRVFQNYGQPWFCLTDVCKILDIKNVSDCKSRLNKDGVVTADTMDNLGRTQQANFINESNLYKVIFQSRKSEAEKFTEWVTNDVLPSIRKHGMYVKDELLDNPDLLIAAVTRLKEEKAARLEAEKKIEALKPKAEFYDDVAGSKDSIEMGHVAKVLGIKGLGRNKLFDLLRQAKVLDRSNIPYQSYVDRGYFRVLEQKYVVPNGETKINIKTMVFQKGVDYIRNIIKEEMQDVI
ncbi:phage antirepressor [Clostridium sp.]|uniref:phage antirepressor n=1 Tax=Clostridium sp. TaxID=1506 RepID=UPI003216ECB8